MLRARIESQLKEVVKKIDGFIEDRIFDDGYEILTDDPHNMRAHIDVEVFVRNIVDLLSGYESILKDIVITSETRSTKSEDYIAVIVNFSKLGRSGLLEGKKSVRGNLTRGENVVFTYYHLLRDMRKISSVLDDAVRGFRKKGFLGVHQYERRMEHKAKIRKEHEEYKKAIKSIHANSFNAVKKPKPVTIVEESVEEGYMKCYECKGVKSEEKFIHPGTGKKRKKCNQCQEDKFNEKNPHLKGCAFMSAKEMRAFNNERDVKHGLKFKCVECEKYWYIEEGMSGKKDTCKACAGKFMSFISEKKIRRMDTDTLLATYGNIE